jgi:hypothetical protein
LEDVGIVNVLFFYDRLEYFSVFWYTL